MPTKRKAEALWMEKQNRWMVKVQTDGERRPFYSSVKGRKGKHEAEAKADEWLESKSSKDIRFEAAWKLYIDYLKSTTGTGNWQNKDSLGRTWLLPALKNKRVSSITENDLEKCIIAAAKDGKAKRTCMNIRSAINNFAKYARKSRLPFAQPEELSIPTYAPEGEKSILQPDQLRILFTKDYTLRYGKQVPCFFIHAFRFAVSRGTRRGEVCGLRKDEIEGNALPINRAINNLGETTKGKSKKARRIIVLSPMTHAILQDQASMLKREGIISPWLFPDEHGERLDSNHFYKAWASYRKAHGITVSLHELRHTYISIMKYDMPEEMLKEMVGHTKSMDTYGVYGHTVEGDREAAASIMDDVFSRLLK